VVDVHGLAVAVNVGGDVGVALGDATDVAVGGVGVQVAPAVAVGVMCVVHDVVGVAVGGTDVVLGGVPLGVWDGVVVGGTPQSPTSKFTTLLPAFGSPCAVSLAV
jgi:hypothetical protein